jgi:hypothetical protein
MWHDTAHHQALKIIFFYIYIIHTSPGITRIGTPCQYSGGSFFMVDWVVLFLYLHDLHEYSECSTCLRYLHSVPFSLTFTCYLISDGSLLPRIPWELFWLHQPFKIVYLLEHTYHYSIFAKRQLKTFSMPLNFIIEIWRNLKKNYWPWICLLK